MRTDLQTLAKSWDILERCGVAGIMTGGEVRLDYVVLLRQLFGNGLLVEFLEVVTGEPVDPESVTLEAALELILRFFVIIGNGFGTFLKGMGMARKPMQEQE